jgi:hypothetical protein
MTRLAQSSRRNQCVKVAKMYAANNMIMKIVLNDSCEAYALCFALKMRIQKRVCAGLVVVFYYSINTHSYQP